MRKVIILIILIFLAIVGLHYFRVYESQEAHKDFLTLYGNVDVRQVDLGFRVMGRVTEMPWQEGDMVPKGSFMARLDRQPYQDQITQAQAAVIANKFQVANAKQLFERRQGLQAGGGVSQEDLENAQYSYDIAQANLAQAQANWGVAQTNLIDTELFAPNDGVILTRIREPGTVVRESDPIYTMTLLDPVWIRAYVSERDLGIVYPGMQAEIYTDTPGGKSYTGTIGFISPVAEFTPKTVETTQLRTDLVYRLRVIADNPDFGLRQGMPVTVKLKIDHQRKRQ